MGRRRSDPWRIKLYQTLIRQVRGKVLLEALYELQDGSCAYDRKPCILLLPYISVDPRYDKQLRKRFATIDHIVPRCLGGSSYNENLVLASQVSNAGKGAYAPHGPWVPRIRHSNNKIQQMIRTVEKRRAKEARALAEMGFRSRGEAIRFLIEQELDRAQVDLEFYDHSRSMVA